MNFAYVMALFIFIFSIPAISGMPVVVNIDDVLHTTTDYINYSKQTTGFQEIITSFENTGSVGCTAFIRVNFYKNNTLLYTSWSDSKALEAGAAYTFRNYWFHQNIEGNIIAKMRAYYCNEIDILDDITFTAMPLNKNSTLNLTILGTTADKNEINITFTTNKTLKNVWIIPKETYIGWRIEPLKTGTIIAEEPHTKTLKYTSSIPDKKATLEYYILDDEKNYAVFQTSNAAPIKEIKRHLEYNPNTIAIVVFFVMAFLVIREKKKFRRLKKHVDAKKSKKEKQ
ncbi:MAG: hypothetical protein KAI53_00525 [Candidatus Aenigmarchaeota archaeon]|nr:hypothetical protein [Candidatus Aenigmarchaeota archaeon]